VSSVRVDVSGIVLLAAADAACLLNQYYFSACLPVQARADSPKGV
jgi:hypothetical protein